MSLNGIGLSISVREHLLLLQSAAFASPLGAVSGNKVNSALNSPAKIAPAAGPDPRPVKNSIDLFHIDISISKISLSSDDAQGNVHRGMDLLQTEIDDMRYELKESMLWGNSPALGYSQKASLALDGPAGAGAAGAPGTAADLTNAGSGTANSLAGKTIVLKTSATATTTITLGTGAGQVNSIADLNSALSKAGIQLTARFDATAGQITLTSTDDAASQVITKTGSFTVVPADLQLTASYDVEAGDTFLSTPAGPARTWVDASYDVKTGVTTLTTPTGVARTLRGGGLITDTADRINEAVAHAGSQSSVDISGTIGTTAAVTAPVRNAQYSLMNMEWVADYNRTLDELTNAPEGYKVWLNGGLLKLESDQTSNSSTTSITSVSLKNVPVDAKALGLRKLTATDLADNVSIVKAIAALDRATAMLSALDPASHSTMADPVELMGGPLAQQLSSVDVQQLSSVIEKRLGIGDLVQFEPRHQVT